MKRALIALACGAACGRGVTVTVVTVDARPSVHAAATLSVEVANASSSFSQDFDLHGHAFPATFSVETPGRSGDLAITARAKDDAGAIVGIGTAAATIVDNDESDVALLLDPADFAVNTQIAGAQRTVFYTSTGARQITASLDGNFTVAWSDDCGSLARCDVWGRRFDKTGASVATAIAAGTSQFNINRTSVFGTDAALATGPDGTVLGLWTTYDEVNGGPGDILCSAIAPDGSAATPAEVTLSDGGAPDHVGVAAFKDQFLVVWQELRKSDNAPSIQLRFVDKTCAPLSGALTLASSTTSAPDTPAIATSLDGTEAAIVWRVGTSIRGRFVTGSSALGVDTQVIGGGNDALWGPELTAMKGGYALVYGAKSADALPNGGYVLHRVKQGGGDLGIETVISATAPDIFSVASVTRRADDALAVAWHDCDTHGDGTGCGVFAQLVRSTGLAVGAPIVMDTTTTGDQTDPSIIALPDAFAAVWTDGSMVPPDQSMTGIRARVLYPAYDDARGVLGAPCAADRPCGANLVCAIGSDKLSHCHAACDPAGAPPLCPMGGACTNGPAGASCIF
ncbi:MAG TPA: hypothetical protein VL463_33535 [Kofleriaceae bacterium]|jgi:hypothetical protein|nr:hypothetical protein [Kofleriaceae bacterium]